MCCFGFFLTSEWSLLFQDYQHQYLAVVQYYYVLGLRKGSLKGNKKSLNKTEFWFSTKQQLKIQNTKNVNFLYIYKVCTPLAQCQFLLWAKWATAQGAIYLGVHERPKKKKCALYNSTLHPSTPVQFCSTDPPGSPRSQN